MAEPRRKKRPAASGHASLTELVAAAVGPRIKDREILTWAWPKIEAEVLALSAHEHSPLFPGLDGEALAAAIGNASRKEQRKALDLAFERLWSALGTRRRDPAGKLARAAIATNTGISDEWARLSRRVQQNIEGGIATWAQLRILMFVAFGAASDPDTAIARINAYYETLEAGGLAGKSSPVHPDLKTSLGKATTLLSTKGSSAALERLRSVGGFNIRKIARTDTLSNHSFGTAVDLDAVLNPDIKKALMPGDLITSLTGVDIFGAESVRLKTAARSYEQSLADAKVLCDASAAFVAAFKDLPSLKAAWLTAIERRYGAKLDHAAIDRAFDLAGAAPPNPSALRSHFGSTGVATASTKECADRLIASLALFRAARKPNLKPSPSGSPAGIARFGFCNLPPELVAALVASDGGGLNWLGAATSKKDSMHFDLRQPPPRF